MWRGEGVLVRMTHVLELLHLDGVEENAMEVEGELTNLGGMNREGVRV